MNQSKKAPIDERSKFFTQYGACDVYLDQIGENVWNYAVRYPSGKCYRFTTRSKSSAQDDALTSAEHLGIGTREDRLHVRWQDDSVATDEERLKTQRTACCGGYLARKGDVLFPGIVSDDGRPEA